MSTSLPPPANTYGAVPPAQAPEPAPAPRPWETPTVRAVNSPTAPESGSQPQAWLVPNSAGPTPPPPRQTTPPPLNPTSDWARQQSPVYYPPPAPGAWNGAAGAPPVNPYAVRSTPLGAPPAVPQPKRRRRWPWYLLLTLLILVGLFAGAWITFLRPLVHQSVDSQIRQGLQAGVNQIPVQVAQDAPAGVPFLIGQDQMNTYLTQQLPNLAPISAISVTLQPNVMIVNLTTNGLGSTVRLGLNLINGKLVAQNVEVSGALSWVENATELTPPLDDSLAQVQKQLGRSLQSVLIADGQLVLVFR